MRTTMPVTENRRIADQTVQRKKKNSELEDTVIETIQNETEENTNLWSSLCASLSSWLLCSGNPSLLGLPRFSACLLGSGNPLYSTLVALLCSKVQKLSQSRNLGNYREGLICFPYLRDQCLPLLDVQSLENTVL